jgi:glycosidase
VGARIWWRDGVIYQIYPRSFMDSNGDGVGDLEGIRRRLDHLAWLGVDGIWLSPCFPSPMADFGYDVADYCDIDPLFGDLADFDRLLADAHARGLRVVLDWVPNHTSERHPWFLESRRGRASPKRDWYVWRNREFDGAPPNNWLSLFGGPAWEWDAASGQCYLHSFLKEQPDLNWRNPEVVRAMHGVLRFWLDRGVDGFRIDVIHRISKDPALRSNPSVEGAGAGWGGQQHVHDEDHPDVHAALRELRKLLDGYSERMLVGEIGLYDPARVAGYYGRGDELHLGFNFSFLRARWSADEFSSELERFERVVPAEGWPTLVLSNHDVPRHASRYDDPLLGEERARLAAMLLLSARGTPFLYYGEEIGMRNAVIPPDRLQDPLARTLHPKLSRDPERTPMQWEARPGAGFSSAAPWLPLAPDFERRNVEVQQRDRGSLLWLYRDLLALRRRTPALERGDWHVLPATDGVLAFAREAPGSRARVALNFTDEPRPLDLGGGRVADGLSTRAGTTLPAVAGKLELDAGEGLVLVLR